MEKVKWFIGEEQTCFKKVGFLNENAGADKTAGHLKKEDYLVIIKWLKIEWNYDSCFGTGKAPAVGCPAK
ncbi:uncharacterized protein VP01_2862g2, partial [Puccinia sorghi]